MYKTHQTHCGHNVQCFNVQSVCTQSNYWALKRKVHDGYREHDEMNNRRDGSARGSAKQTKAVNFTATRHKQESIFFSCMVTYPILRHLLFRGATTLFRARCCWCSWLTRCATSRKVVSSIANSVSGIFH